MYERRKAFPDKLFWSMVACIWAEDISPMFKNCKRLRTNYMRDISLKTSILPDLFNKSKSEDRQLFRSADPLVIFELKHLGERILVQRRQQLLVIHMGVNGGS